LFTPSPVTLCTSLDVGNGIFPLPSKVIPPTVFIGLLLCIVDVVSSPLFVLVVFKSFVTSTLVIVLVLPSNTLPAMIPKVFY